MYFKMLVRAFTFTVMPVAVALFAMPAQAVAQAAGQPTIVTDTIGGQAMRFALRPGECALQHSLPSDKRLLTATEALIANSNFLHVLTADCKELVEWRVGRVKFLGDGMQIQSLKAAANENFRGREKALVDEICAHFRTNAGDLSNTAVAEIKKRIEETSNPTSIDSLKFLGVMGRDDNACYVSARLAGKREDGSATVRMMVFATAVVQGKVLYIYRYSDRQDAIVLKDLMAELSADVGRQYAANR